MDVCLLPNLGLTRRNVHMNGNQLSRVQAVQYSDRRGSRKGPPGSSSFHRAKLCLSPWACRVPVPQPLKTNPNSLSVSTSICSVPRSPPTTRCRCCCPLLASTNTPSRPLSPDPTAEHLPTDCTPFSCCHRSSVRRGVWCGFVAPDVVALRARRIASLHPLPVRQVLLPSCTVISSRAVFSLVSTLVTSIACWADIPSHNPSPRERSPDGSDSRSRHRGADPVAVRPNTSSTADRITVRTRAPIRILLQGRVLASPPPEQSALDIIPSSPEPPRGPGTPTRRQQWPPRRPSRARAGVDGPPAPVQAPPIPHHHQDGTWDLCIHKDNRPGKHGQGQAGQEGGDQRTGKSRRFPVPLGRVF